MTSPFELAEVLLSQFTWVANKLLLAKTTRPKILLDIIQHGLSAVQKLALFTRCVASAVPRIIVLKTGTQFPEKTGDMLKPVMLKTVINFFADHLSPNSIKISKGISWKLQLEYPLHSFTSMRSAALLFIYKFEITFLI